MQPSAYMVRLKSTPEKVFNTDGFILITDLEKFQYIREARAISVKPHMFVYKASKSTVLCWAFIPVQTINYATSN